MDSRNMENRRLKQKLKMRKNPGSAKEPTPTPTQLGVVHLEDSSDDQYSKRSVSSNWSYYDEEDIGPENEQMSAANFEEILQMGREIDKFVLQAEKDWENDPGIFDTSNSKNYFELHLQLLNVGLHTIPFYKRLDYDKSLFSKHQIKKMNANALKAEDYYQAALKKYEERASSAGSRINSAKSEKFKQDPELPILPESQPTNQVKSPPPDPTPPAPRDDKDDELDELLSLTTSNVEKMNVMENNANSDKPDEAQPAEKHENTEQNPEVTSEAKGPEVNNKEDIQQWLDDILNE